MQQADLKTAAERLGWDIEICECSPAVYVVIATHPNGGRVESIGSDADKLLADVAARALAGSPEH
jgi:hypothetical protein